MFITVLTIAIYIAFEFLQYLQMCKNFIIMQ